MGSGRRSPLNRPLPALNSVMGGYGKIPYQYQATNTPGEFTQLNSLTPNRTKSRNSHVFSPDFVNSIEKLGEKTLRNYNKIL